MRVWTQKICPKHIHLFWTSQELSPQKLDCMDHGVGIKALIYFLCFTFHNNVADIKDQKPKNKVLETYLFVAGPFQDIKNPIMNKTKPWMTTVDGLSGNTSRRIAARGMADAELIWASIILPAFGRRMERISPILPPNSPPSELPITNKAIRKADFPWEKPVSSSHMGANDNADQGNEPVTPCATTIWKEGILITDLASWASSLTCDHKELPELWLLSFVSPSGKCGSVAYRRTKMPTRTLISPTRWKEILQPGIPMKVIGAINMEQSPPIIEPRFPVSWSHPKAIPRFLSSVESATRDCIAGATRARPIPFKALDIATWSVKAEWLQSEQNKLEY